MSCSKPHRFCRGANGRLLLVLLLCAAALALMAPGMAYGQAETNCTERLEQDRELYEARRYDEVISRLSTCLWRSDLSTSYVEEAYRLLALTHLRTDDVPSAKLAILELLDRAPGYQPDPVNDLPSYVSLVRLVRQQVQVPAADTTASEPDATLQTAGDDAMAGSTPALADGRRFSIALHAGLNNYHGERSPSTGGAGELTAAAGTGFGAALGYRLTPHFNLGLYYLAGRYPSLLDEKGASYPAVDRTASSDWLHMTGLLARWSFLPRHRVSPVAHLGLNGAFSLINNTLRASIGPRFGVGADVYLTPRLDAVISAGGILLVPDTGTDVASTSTSISDLYSYVTVGLRYRLALSP